jgi:hypothetical protein
MVNNRLTLKCLFTILVPRRLHVTLVVDVLGVRDNLRNTRFWRTRRRGGWGCEDPVLRLPRDLAGRVSDRKEGRLKAVPPQVL